jgi:hypothetical protein
MRIASGKGARMSLDLARKPAVFLTDVTPADRRSHPRYAIEMSLRYKISGNHDVREGSGKTCDLSTGGVFFSADQIMPKLDVELWIDWPFLLENVCPLYLKISGYVVRNCETGSAVKIRRYEFRTRGI